VFETERSDLAEGIDMRAHSLGDLGDRERVESASNASYSDSLFDASKSNLRACRVYLNEEVWHDLPLDQLPRSEGACLSGDVSRPCRRSRLASECCFFLLTILNQWFPERLLDTGKMPLCPEFDGPWIVDIRFQINADLNICNSPVYHAVAFVETTGHLV
ncbi:hypothetical protein Tco_0217779, partial [Tanacetum coccineum]